MDHEELKQKSRPELIAIAKEKCLKYCYDLRKDVIIQALILIQQFPKGWEDLKIEEFYEWLDGLEGFQPELKLEFKVLMHYLQFIAKKKRPLKCHHGKVKNVCRDCGGSRFCPHNKRKDTCRHCQTSTFCKHNRMKRSSKDCGGKGICPHGKQKAFCKPCGGSQICVHDKQKAKCKECSG